MDKLDQIIQHKKQELKRSVKSFKEALRSDGLSVIAEYKKKSPSKGIIKEKIPPAEMAKIYEEAKASAISVLTDKKFFSGSVADLFEVATNCSLPILRKDFIIDKSQIEESKAIGASAILLIVRVLGKKIGSFLEKAKQLGLDVLVEVHDRDELFLAIDSGADIIGVNHRNLKTFTMDQAISASLIRDMPDHVIKVAESGIETPDRARELRELGYDAVLIGEALMRSSSPKEFIHAIN